MKIAEELKQARARLAEVEAAGPCVWSPNPSHWLPNAVICQHRARHSSAPPKKWECADGARRWVAELEARQAHHERLQACATPQGRDVWIVRRFQYDDYATLAVVEHEREARSIVAMALARGIEGVDCVSYTLGEIEEGALP